MQSEVQCDLTNFNRITLVSAVLKIDWGCRQWVGRQGREQGSHRGRLVLP